MGHREDVWDNPKFQAILIGGIEWAGGRVNAEIKPNVAEIAPGGRHFAKALRLRIFYSLWV